MKIVLLLLVSVIALSADGFNLPIPAPPSTYSLWTKGGSRMEKEENGDDEGFERSTCKIRPDCAFRGGSCTTNATTCIGRVVEKGCKGKGCHCCIPGCPEEKGFFMLPGSNQCFKIDFSGGEVNHTLAKSACIALGLKLAHPTDAIGLRSFIMQKYGLQDEIWLDAQGAGSMFVWGDGYPLHSNSALWHPDEPTTTNNGSCLQLGTYGSQWKDYPDRPFLSGGCSVKEYPLCERLDFKLSANIIVGPSGFGC